MTPNESDKQDTMTYKVVVNHEEQYSIWLDYKEIPAGWRSAGKVGPKEECLAYIKEIWTDMRPLSLRKKMETLANDPEPIASNSDSNTFQEESLVDRLCEGEHPVEVSCRPQKTIDRFAQAIDLNYLHIKFPQTRGGTELGVSLDRNASDFSTADFKMGKGTAHVEGDLTLDYVKLRCIADIELSTLSGKGRLVKVAGAAG
ncbi:MAG TPA: MbtH family NRPS accessory protein [Terriglobales bacterium]|nr:MbtH family NRPS accessory protein [Terriglobales bacterium]